MLKFDVESKAGSQVQDADQAELYHPTESELQMAQVGLFILLVLQLQILTLFLLIV